MAHLSHPHVVRLHGICTSAAPRALHIVMELATGGSLDTLVKPGGRLHSSGPLPLTSPSRLAEVARLGSQAALGLLHAHAKGIAHCDVKLAHLCVDLRVSFWLSRPASPLLTPPYPPPPPPLLPQPALRVRAPAAHWLWHSLQGEPEWAGASSASGRAPWAARAAGHLWLPCPRELSGGPSLGAASL